MRSFLITFISDPCDLVLRALMQEPLNWYTSFLILFFFLQCNLHRATNIFFTNANHTTSSLPMTSHYTRTNAKELSEALDLDIPLTSFFLFLILMPSTLVAVFLALFAFFQHDKFCFCLIDFGPLFFTQPGMLVSPS